MIIGIDVSTKDVAIAVISNRFGEVSNGVYIPGETYLIYSTKITSDKKYPENVTEIFKKFEIYLSKLWFDLLKETSGEIRIYIEKARYQAPIVFNQINRGYYEMIGMILPLIPHWFIDNHYKLDIVSPPTWKKGLNYPSVKGLTPKQKGELSIKIASELVGEQVLDNDIADAINIAIGSFRREQENGKRN